ncbi:MAG: DUF3769 domain-containing protein, partial [Chroococcidiopsidaceae cyanobacterium CP_BM_ER_R8_30]|nr:DUF3769 domain-containing protein [Chroococcidiopsidaceae cyanobacterium CP_BM_ER_R8_30]
MPHPLPPALPSIVQPSRSEDIPLTASTNTPASLSDFTQPVSLIAPSPSNPSGSNATKSAELLGPAVGVGYPTMPNETRVLVSPNPPESSDTLPLAPTESFSISSSSITKKLNASLPLPLAPPAPLPLCSPSSSAPPAPSALLFRFTVVQPQPATLSVLAQEEQQRQPVVQPPPPPSLPTPKPPSPTPGQTSGPNSSPVGERIIELSSQRQEYDTQRHIVTAEGNVELRTSGVVLTANRLQANLQNLIAVAEGNVIVTRGQQVLRGQRLTYNFVQDSGEILYARGDVDLPATRTDFSGTLPTDVTTGGVLQQTPDQRAILAQPVQQVTSTGGIGLSFGGGRYVNQAPPKKGGTIRRLRFQAERINFYPGGWQATNVQITNDPFSPPELELRANTATLTQQTPTQSLIVTTQPRLVFDQGFTLPIPKREATIGRRQRSVNAFPIQIGYDSTDKGGLFIARGFTL